MNAAVKSVLLKVAKNAVNAGITALGPITLWHQQFNLTTKAGFVHVLMVMGSAAVSRELMVWVPVLLKWSQTSDAQ